MQLLNAILWTSQILFLNSTFCFMDSTKVLVFTLRIRPGQTGGVQLKSFLVVMQTARGKVRGLKNLRFYFSCPKMAGWVEGSETIGLWVRVMVHE